MNNKNVLTISGVLINPNKRLFIALAVIKGIGYSSAKKISKTLTIDYNKKIFDLSDEEISKIRNEISKNYTIEGDLRSIINSNIQQKKDNGSYAGSRHKKNLPVHGQRTKTNARTRKGKRKTIANKKQVTK